MMILRAFGFAIFASSILYSNQMWNPMSLKQDMNPLANTIWYLRYKLILRAYPKIILLQITMQQPKLVTTNAK